MDEYSGFKAAWHIDRINDLRNGKDIVPTYIQLVISDFCNQNCHFCSYRMDGGFAVQNFGEEGEKNPKRFIPSDKVREILDDCRAVGVKAILFTGGGEPTIHKDWEDLIGYAQDLGLDTALTTNGVRMNRSTVIEKLKWLRISLDAGTPETYEKVRESKAWPKAMKAVNLAGSLGIFSGVNFVTTRENYLEISTAARIAKYAGVSNFRISAMASMSGGKYYDGILGEIEKQRSEARGLANDKFSVIDSFAVKVDELNSHSPDYSFCGYQQFTLYIGGDQKVYTCCINAYTDLGMIGDLRTQSFSDWLKSYRRFGFDARQCHDCHYNNQNRMINYLLEKNPNHVNFV